MIVKDVLLEGRASLCELAKDRALFEARLLLSHVLKCTPVDLIVNDNRKVSRAAEEEFKDLVERRSHSEPVAYLTRKKEFRDIELFVDSRVLIPRPETESLVEGVLSWIRAENLQGGKILDLGTGSGCVALSLAKDLGENFEVIGIDSSAEALEVAEMNKRSLKIKNIEWRQLDILKGPSDLSEVQVIVSNPPYIPEEEFQDLDRGIRNYEPLQALHGGRSGLDFYHAIFSNWTSLLSRPGLLALETSSEYQRMKIQNEIQASSSESIWIHGPHYFKEFVNSNG